MRINFGAAYKEVEKLLKASTKPTERLDDEAFEKSLGSLVAQPIENPVDIAPPLIKSSPHSLSQTPMEEVRASYQFEDPGLIMPGMSPLAPPESAPIESEIGGMSVKTPTLLEARRVTLNSTAFTPITGSSSAAAPSPEAAKVSGQTSTKFSGAYNNSMPPQLDQKEIMSRLSVASEKLGLDPALAMSVVKAESGFNIKAVSADGHNSKGLFQLLDSTGLDLLARAGEPGREYNPFDPDLNMELGTSYLRYLHDIFRTSTPLPNSRSTRSAADERSLEQLAVAAFNAGEGRVASAQYRTEQAGKDPAHYDNVAPFLPRSTREYVARVVRGKRLF